MSKQYTSKSQPPKRTTTGHESQDVMRNDLLLLTKMSRENPIGNTTLAVQLLWIPTAADAVITYRRQNWERKIQKSTLTQINNDDNNNKIF